MKVRCARRVVAIGTCCSIAFVSMATMMTRVILYNGCQDLVQAGEFKPVGEKHGVGGGGCVFLIRAYEAGCEKVRGGVLEGWRRHSCSVASVGNRAALVEVDKWGETIHVSTFEDIVPVTSVAYIST